MPYLFHDLFIWQTFVLVYTCQLFVLSLWLHSRDWCTWPFIPNDPCPCSRHPSPCQGYISHGNTTGLDLVSKWTLVIPFDLCHVGYREVCISSPGHDLANINTSQIPVKYNTNGMQLKVWLCQVTSRMQWRLLRWWSTFKHLETDSMIMCCCE
jgi:hypothetical protein